MKREDGTIVDVRPIIAVHPDWAFRYSLDTSRTDHRFELQALTNEGKVLTLETGLIPEDGI